MRVEAPLYRNVARQPPVGSHTCSASPFMAYLPGKFTRPDGKVDYNQASNMAFQCAENVRRSQATVAGIKSNPKGGFDLRVTFPAAFFAVDSLSQHGK
jgi:hypothetical protein